MVAKVAEKSLWVLLVLSIFISIGVLYYKYIVMHEYDILTLTPEEIQQFLEENAEEDTTAIPAEDGELETTPNTDVASSTGEATTTDAAEDVTADE